MESLEPYLEKLLLCKAFSELSGAEKEYVLESISKEDYDKFRETLAKSVLALKTADLAPVLSPEVATNLKKAFQDRHKKTYAWPVSFARFHFQLPVIPAGLALCTIVLLVYLFHQGFTGAPQLVTGKTQKSDLDVNGALAKPELKEELVLPLQTEQSSNKVNTDNKETAKQPEVKAQPNQIEKNAPIQNSFNEGESYMLAENMEVETDPLDEEMFDTDNLTIPGINVGLLMPETN
jgi:hypothetical protein